MAEHQRIYPVDVEAGKPHPSAPLVPRDAVVSEKGDPAEEHRPFRRTMPVQYLPPPRQRRNCCLRCCCWMICLVVTLAVLVAVTAAALYLIFRPKSPSYSVDQLRITDFQANPTTLEVAASFEVMVTAKNPNKAIGIYYVEGSRLSASYLGTALCEGQLPVFYQGHRNTTEFKVILSGKAQFTDGDLTALRNAQNTGMVPLVFNGRIPVRIKFGKLKLWKVKFYVTCDLVASDLAVDRPVRIRSSSCRFKFRM